jgi:arylsulfatase A-like enzyme
VPLIARGPRVARGVVDDHAASTLDLPPTILAAAGLAPEKRWSGRDLGPVLAGRRGVGPAEAFLELGDVARPGVPEVEYRAVRTPTHKLILWREPRGAELYDLVADPEERRNLFEDPTATATRRDLAKRLGRWLAATDDPARRWKSAAAVVP